MIVDFATKKIESAVNSANTDDMTEIERIIRRKKAPCTADEILETLNALEAADTLHEVPPIPLHPHP